MFESFASLLLPIEEGVSATVMEADERWSRPDPPPATDVLIWGRAPWPPGTPWHRLANAAPRRELRVRTVRRRPPLGFSVRGVHRWPPPEFRLGPVGRDARAALLGGAVVEFLRRPATRVIDACATAAGAAGEVTALRPVTAGSAMAPIAVEGEPCLLRVVVEGGPGDPDRAGEALERLAGAHVPLVPRPIGRGRTAGARWSAQTLLPGRRPRRVDRRLADQVRDFAVLLPHAEGPSVAPFEDLRALVEWFPEAAPALERATSLVRRASGELPTMMRHGDLWSGNVLVSGTSLSGVIDWDSWHPSALPGTDLLHFYAAERALRRGLELAELWTDRPWDTDAFRSWTREYWSRLGVTPSAEALEGVGAAWWAGRVAYRVSLRPYLRHDEPWVERNVAGVVDRI